MRAYLQIISRNISPAIRARYIGHESRCGIYLPRIVPDQKDILLTDEDRILSHLCFNLNAPFKIIQIRENTDRLKQVRVI